MAYPQWILLLAISSFFLWYKGLFPFGFLSENVNEALLAECDAIDLDPSDKENIILVARVTGQYVEGKKKLK